MHVCSKIVLVVSSNECNEHDRQEGRAAQMYLSNNKGGCAELPNQPTRPASNQEARIFKSY